MEESRGLLRPCGDRVELTLVWLRAVMFVLSVTPWLYNLLVLFVDFACSHPQRGCSYQPESGAVSSGVENWSGWHKSGTVRGSRRGVVLRTAKNSVCRLPT